MRCWVAIVAIGCAGDDDDKGTWDGPGNPDLPFPTTESTSDPTSPTSPADCGPVPGAAGPADVLEECSGAGAVVQDPWQVQVEWSYTASGETVVSPVTGHLTDDDGDGTIGGPGDVPDVAFTSYTDATLVVVSGDGSGLVCSVPDWKSTGGVIVADVDRDGENEVVGPVDGGRVRAVDGACATEWTSAQSYDLDIVVTTAADLDGDGVVEVIADIAVLDGPTGAHRATLVPEDDDCLRAPFTGDFDLDGQLEVMLANTVFSSDGAPLWSVPGDGTSCFGGVADLDADPEGEVFLSYGFVFGVYEHDGAPIWEAPLDVPNPGPPCAGDLDDDGEIEVVAPHGRRITAFEPDGAVLWEREIDDNSGSAACSVFDLDGDGVVEVLHGDEEAFRIYDGPTGTVRVQRGAHRSVTFFESPTVADVDGDGAAEVLLASSSFSLDVEGGLTVLGHGGAGWPPTGPTWGLHDYSVTNQGRDGSIPQNPEAPWLTHRLFRGQVSDAVPPRPNLSGEVVNACATSCDADGNVVVTVRVANDGGAEADAATVALYTVDPATGAETFAASAPLLQTLAGDVVPDLVLEVPVDAWTGEYVVRLDDDGGGVGGVGECHEDDNEIRGSAALCP